MQSEDVVRVLAALAQDNRHAAFRQLVQAGEDGVPAGVKAKPCARPSEFFFDTPTSENGWHGNLAISTSNCGISEESSPYGRVSPTNT